MRSQTDGCFHVGPRRILSVVAMQIAKNNKTIETLEEWFLHAPPEKGEKQWVDGRSAKEMARAWLIEKSRQWLLDVLRPVFGSVTLESAEPECSVPFDEFSGPRQCDLSILASNDRGRIVIHIEGKADEAFGLLTGEAYDVAVAANACVSARGSLRCGAGSSCSRIGSLDALWTMPCERLGISCCIAQPPR